MNYTITTKEDADNVATILKGLPLDSKPYAVKVEKITGSRSNYQNRYYWGVVLKTISNDTGSTPQELHDIFKTMFLKDFVFLEGKEVEKVGDTKGLKSLEFEDYLTKIRRFASMELNIFIGLPNEYIIDEL
jgi:hypothetical protein